MWFMVDGILDLMKYNIYMCSHEKVYVIPTVLNTRYTQYFPISSLVLF